jgi:hypothetical protein
VGSRDSVTEYLDSASRADRSVDLAEFRPDRKIVPEREMPAVANRVVRTLSAALAVAGLAASAGCAGGSPEPDPAPDEGLGGVRQRAIDPCTLLTGTDLEGLLGTATTDAIPEGRTHSVCLLIGHPMPEAKHKASRTSQRAGQRTRETARRSAAEQVTNGWSVRVTLLGDVDTAPAVYAAQLRSGPDPQRVPEVGPAAFAVARPDEVGIVTLTPRAVLGVSLLAERSPVRDREAILDQLMPVVRHATDRL